MEKYLYLTEVAWAKAWMEGGKVPLNLASTYRRLDRQGIYTPDENLIHESEIPIPELQQYGIHIEESKDITIGSINYNGRHVGGIKNANFYTEDGLILSLCNSLSDEIALKLGKKCCVRIKDVERLRKRIDKQLGFKGVMKSCSYTDDHQRNHFLKSVEDAWQDEYRIFWKHPKAKIVLIPEGTAEFCREY